MMLSGCEIPQPADGLSNKRPNLCHRPLVTNIVKTVSVALLLLLCIYFSLRQRSDVRVVVDLGATHPVAPNLYGIFFEEVMHNAQYPHQQRIHPILYRDKHPGVF